jgi:Flp pilus assembly protein TadD
LETIDPQATEFYKMVNEAFALAQANKIPESIALLRSALERDPDDAMAHYNLGTLLTNSGEPHDALDEFRKASALSPGDTTFLEHYAVALALNGDRSAAVVELQKAVAIDPASAPFRFNLGYMMEANGDFAEAVAPLEKAVELSEGKNGRFVSELAKAYDKTGRTAEAVASARKALDLAVQEHDAQREKDMRDLLDRYEHSTTEVKPQ